MLNVQRWLHENDINYERLTAEFGVDALFHPTYPLVKLNYNQINSVKSDPKVSECRGLVLNRETLEVVGASFHRFFNLGEMEAITGQFDWTNFGTYEKVDGSMIMVYWNPFDQRWNANTRGSWGDQPLLPNAPTWSELVFQLLGNKLKHLDQNCTYVFELCSLYNKVVREYKTPTLYLLGILHNGSEQAWNDFNPVDYRSDVVDVFARKHGFKRPERYNFTSVDQLKAFLKRQETEDPTFEGCVLQDWRGLRLKVKSLSYCSLHHLKGNGNLFLNKNLLPFVLNGETAEVIAYFPECKERADKLTKLVRDYYNGLVNLWLEVKDIQDQKEFALAVQKRHPMSSMLFDLRKRGGDIAELNKMFWVESLDGDIEHGEDLGRYGKAILKLVKDQ